MFSTIVHFDSLTGARIAMRHQPAQGSPLASILLCHDLAEHSLRYASFAQTLARRGLDVLAYDHRGHGLTQATDAPSGAFARRAGDQALVSDCLNVLDEICRKEPALPVILTGFGLGGLVALQAAAAFDTRVRGLSLWNMPLYGGLASLPVRLGLKLERALKGSDVPSLFAEQMSFRAWAEAAGSGPNRFGWLSRSSDAMLAYEADPHCGILPLVSAWQDIIALSQAAGRTLRSGTLSTLPIHMAAGTGDPVTHFGADVENVARRLRAGGGSAICLEVYQEMRHDLLHDQGAEKVVEDYAGWALQVIQHARRPR